MEIYGFFSYLLSAEVSPSVVWLLFYFLIGVIFVVDMAIAFTVMNRAEHLLMDHLDPATTSWARKNRLNGTLAMIGVFLLGIGVLLETILFLGRTMITNVMWPMPGSWLLRGLFFLVSVVVWKQYSVFRKEEARRRNGTTI